MPFTQYEDFCWSLHMLIPTLFVHACVICFFFALYWKLIFFIYLFCFNYRNFFYWKKKRKAHDWKLI